MSGTYQALLANGNFRVLSHGLKCRDLAGVIVGLAQNSTVKVFSVDSLPGWSILQNEDGWYAPVRDESVHQISVLATQDGHPPFPPAALADATVYDTTELDPIFLIVLEDVVVCDSHGQGLTIGAGSVVSIFAHSPTTFVWFNTADGQTFVADVRHPIKMRPALQEHGSNGQGARPDATPRGFPSAPRPVGSTDGQTEQMIVETSKPQVESSQLQGGEATSPLGTVQTLVEEDEIHEDVLPIDESSALQAEVTIPVDKASTTQPVTSLDTPITEVIEKSPEPEELGGALAERPNHFEEEGLGQVFLPELAPTAGSETPEPSMADANFLRGVQATLQDFTNDDDDFCQHCFSFKIDHAAHCPHFRQ